MPPQTSEINDIDLHPSSQPSPVNQPVEASGQTGDTVSVSFFESATTPQLWDIETSSSPIDQIFEAAFANDCTGVSDNLREHHSCPICYRTISSTSGSSYSSSVHSCEGSLHRRGPSTRSHSDMQANAANNSNSSNDHQDEQIVIRRNPVTLESLEAKQPPIQTPYRAQRKVGKRLLPGKVTPYGVLTGFFPIIKWLPAYDVKGDLIADILAGITVLALQIPQGLAYSKLAGVPAVHGLYATFFSMLIYPLMATSKHVSMGLYAITSMMCRGVIENFSGTFEKPPNGIEILITLCFMTGVIQFVIGILRLGNLSLLFSDNFLSAFTVACSILIVNSQIPPTIGIGFSDNENADLPIQSDCLNSWISIVRHISESNVATCVLSASVILFLLIIKYYVEPHVLVKRYNWKYPIPSDLIAIIFTTIISMVVDLKGKYGVDVVGDIPSGFEAPKVPRFDLVSPLITDAIIMAVVASVSQISLAKLASKKYGYPISLNQEFLAYGATNLFCSFNQCIPTCASLARTSVNENAGSRTQLTAVICSGLMVSFMLFFTTYLAQLPKATLSSIIIVAMIPSLILVRDLFRVIYISRYDALLWIVTCFAVTFTTVNMGIFCGLGTSIGIILLRAAIPTSSIKIPFEKSELYVSPEVYTGLDELEANKTFVFNFQGPLTFLSSVTFKTDVYNKILKPLEALHAERVNQDPNNNSNQTIENDVSKLDGIQVVGHDNLSFEKGDEYELKNSEVETKAESTGKIFEWYNALILDMSQIIHIDVTGIEMLKELQSDLQNLHCKLLLASCSISVLSTLERAHFIPSQVAKTQCFLSVHDAVIASKEMLTDSKDST